jgi:hypothetical protein
MATINATISINSDILNYPVNINKSMTMTKAGTSTGLAETTGLANRKFTSTDQVDLIKIANESITENGANKVYIRNTGSSKANYFIITLGQAGAGSPTDTEEIGRLYGGDWMLFPWEVDTNDGDGATDHASNADVCIAPRVR